MMGQVYMQHAIVPWTYADLSILLQPSANHMDGGCGRTITFLRQKHKGSVVPNQCCGVPSIP